MEPFWQEIERLTRSAGSEPTPTGIPRLVMIKGNVPASQLIALYEPMIGLVLRGVKVLKIGDEVLRCEAPSYFVLPVELPVTGTVESPDDASYLSVGLTLHRETLAALLNDLPPDSGLPGSSPLVACPAGEELLQVWLRLLSLMDAPQDIPALAPVYERELLYRVLQGPQGWMLRELARVESPLNRIEKTASWIKQHLAESFSVDHLAQQAGMSVTAYHRHFRAATGMSPIQFQKHLRLHRARSLLLVNAQTVSMVAYEVGYESPSQFNREYSRLFGSSPARDVAAFGKRPAIPRARA